MTRLVKLATFLAAVSSASAASAADLLVNVTGVRSDKGSVALCLWDRAGFFPNCIDHPAYRGIRLPARAGSMAFRLTDVPPGAYAVSVYHDEKNIRRLEKTILGMPLQGTGASNDAKGRFGPPSFRDASIKLGLEGGAVSLKLVYP